VLEALENNDRAKLLYIRLGFEVTKVWGREIFMRWEHKSKEEAV
jgi:hypothetical protein